MPADHSQRQIHFEAMVSKQDRRSCPGLRGRTIRAVRRGQQSSRWAPFTDCGRDHPSITFDGCAIRGVQHARSARSKPARWRKHAMQLTRNRRRAALYRANGYGPVGPPSRISERVESYRCPTLTRSQTSRYRPGIRPHRRKPVEAPGSAAVMKRRQRRDSAADLFAR